MVLLPKTERILATLGENIKLARLRRRLSTMQVSERAGISRSTLNAVEKGQPGVSLGIYARVLHILGLEKDLLSVAKDDVLGKKLQDAGLLVKKRAPKRGKATND
ncbi:MAG: helix-turn-helix transcriptional regulator [Bacteroidales bacterium]|nr:helix-turn-helix transcriptional regulator [Bacteroidales bacterium]